MSDTPRYYKWYPTVSCDLGTMPFEGDYTKNDRIQVPNESGIATFYISNAAGTEFGRTVQVRVGGRIKSEWRAGVTIPDPVYVEVDGQQVQVPVWFCYYGDGVCTVKLPNGEQPEPYEPEET